VRPEKNRKREEKGESDMARMAQGFGGNFWISQYPTRTPNKVFIETNWGDVRGGQARPVAEEAEEGRGEGGRQ